MKIQQRTHKAASHLMDAFPLVKVKNNNLSILKQNFITKSQHIIHFLNIVKYYGVSKLSTLFVIGLHILIVDFKT